MPSSKSTPAPAEVKPPQQTFTQWDAFNKAKIVPTTIICDVIHLHPADEACKTRLPLESQNMLNHYAAGHGGGFQVKVKQMEGKFWPGWGQLQDAGMEIVQLKCEVCDKVFRVTPQEILKHLRPHQGKFRGAWQNFRDTFFIQINNKIDLQPSEDDDDSYLEDIKY